MAPIAALTHVQPVAGEHAAAWQKLGNVLTLCTLLVARTVRMQVTSLDDASKAVKLCERQAHEECMQGSARRHRVVLELSMS